MLGGCNGGVKWVATWTGSEWTGPWEGTGSTLGPQSQTL